MKSMTVRVRMIISFIIIWALMIFIGVAAISTLDKVRKNEVSSQYIAIAQILMIGALIVAILVGLFLEVTVLRILRVSIGTLHDAILKLASGDATVVVHKTADDEFGSLIDDFQKLLDNVKYQTSVAEKLMVGDLTIEVKTNGEHDILGNAFAGIVKENNQLLSSIRDSTMQVNVGADQVAGASQALAQGSTQQASAIEQVTASMGEIAERTKVNAEQANEANQLIKNIKSEATSGDGQMNEMISAMTDINESSENISKIIKVIDNIAFQTNILALNAAVEAARAGVHGKGFAVVAEEVRNLADKSASAASETAEMIEDSIKKVEQGSRLAEQTATALGSIMGAIERIVNLIDNIAIASNDQATAVTQIDQAISQVSQVVQTNSATSEQCAAASEELSNQAITLRNLVSNYKLDTEGKRPASPVNSAYKGSSESENFISLDNGYGKY